MQVLILTNYLLIGVIPPWLQSLGSLNVLEISCNKLDGNILPWLGKLDNCFNIDLSNNSFSGKLPVSFTQMRSLNSNNGSSKRSPTEGSHCSAIKANPPSSPLDWELWLGFSSCCAYVTVSRIVH
ncbi:Phytosulfokine receptor 1 [Zea mays]|nr:Phytosulfokine receptor 1 [Zea mays]